MPRRKNLTPQEAEQVLNEHAARRPTRPAELRLLSVSHEHDGYVWLMLHTIPPVPHETTHVAITRRDAKAALTNLAAILTSLIDDEPGA